MSRRPSLRVNDLKTTLAALRASGLQPTRFDVLPDGSQRWYFTQTAEDLDSDLDRELREFEAAHGQGRA